jgi:hypothetical protein
VEQRAGVVDRPEGLIVLGLTAILSANASVQRIPVARRRRCSRRRRRALVVHVPGNLIDRLDKPGYLTLRDGERTGRIIGVHRLTAAALDEENTRPLAPARRAPGCRPHAG